MRRFILAVIVAALASGCGFLVDDDKAKHAAQSQGYAFPEITERYHVFADWYGCNDAEFAAFIMRAMFLDTTAVQITMCCAPFHGNCRVANQSPR